MLSEIKIAGAGPAGLSAAITLAKAGRKVIVSECKSNVGARFNGDFQGLENWSGDLDVIDWLQDLGIESDFVHKGFSQGTVFDAWGKEYPVSSAAPLFYLIERGPDKGSLDNALLRQALALGVEVRFNQKINQIKGPGIIATGPKAADAIAAGYHFETTMQDGFWTILDDELAPKGYAYLLVMNGRGTVKTCMFTGFKQQEKHLKRTIEAFERLVGLQMVNPRFHGGVGNFYLPKRAMSGVHPNIGEIAGFQDFLWGFGLRFAIYSGVLAANNILGISNYQQLWRTELAPQMRTASVNRWIFNQLGNQGYRKILTKSVTAKWDAKQKIGAIYRPSWFKQLVSPLALRWLAFRRKDVSCDHIDCCCVWCRHGEHS